MPVIGLVPGKAGVGKTTICANLGVLLAKEFEAGSLLVDLNLRASSLGLWFGLREDLPVTLDQILQEEAKPGYGVFKDPRWDISILTAPLEAEKLEPKGLKEVFKPLREKFEKARYGFKPFPDWDRGLLLLRALLRAGFVRRTPPSRKRKYSLPRGIICSGR